MVAVNNSSSSSTTIVKGGKSLMEKKDRQVTTTLPLFRINQDENGTFLIAAKDVPVGTIVLEESPILQLLPNELNSCCFACGNIFMDSNSIRFCSTCTWPICSVDCEEESIHKDHECKFFNENGIQYREFKVFRRLDMISAVVRGITIKMYQPEHWKSLLSLGMSNVKQEFQIQPCHLDFLYQKLSNILGSSELDGALHIGSMILQLFVQKSLTFKEHVYSCGRLSRTEKSRNILYKKSSLLDHSCSPNCIIQMGQFPNCNIQIRSIIPITRGEKLTVAKFDIFEKGTLERRTKIYSMTKNICECSRCTSPHESQSYASAIRCSQCLQDEKVPTVKRMKFKQINNNFDVHKDVNNNNDKQANDNDDEIGNTGYFLPDEYAESDQGVYPLIWKCNRCSKVDHLFNFYHNVGDIANELQKYDPQQNPHVNLKEAEKFCQDFIQKYSGSLLHPNHFLNQRAHRILVINIQRKKMFPGPFGQPNLRHIHGSGNMEEINEYIKMCDYLLRIQDYVQPGFSEFRDELNYCRFTAIKRKLYITPHTKQDSLELLGEMSKIAKLCNDFHKYSLPLPGQEGNELAIFYSSEFKVINDILLPFYNAL